jgi:hypothetical protein
MAKLDPLDRARRAAKRRLAHTPRVIAAHFDKRTGRVVIHLSTKLDLAFAPEDAQGLEGARAAQLSPIEISPSGLGIHFPKLDADIYIPALLEGFLGSKKWMASRLGASGGRSTSHAKVSAARENGRLGGRPRKRASAVA